MPQMFSFYSRRNEWDLYNFYGRARNSCQQENGASQQLIANSYGEEELFHSPNLLYFPDTCCHHFLFYFSSILSKISAYNATGQQSRYMQIPCMLPDHSRHPCLRHSNQVVIQPIYNILRYQNVVNRNKEILTSLAFVDFSALATILLTQSIPEMVFLCKHRDISHQHSHYPRISSSYTSLVTAGISFQVFEFSRPLKRLRN